MSDENKLSPEEDSQAQKEIMAALFDAEMGGKTFVSDDADMPPEVLETFLNQVRDFHAQEGNEITVRDYLGDDAPKPPFQPKNKEAAQAEVEKVIAILEAKQILLLFPDDLNLRDKYIFLMHDLQNYEFLPPVGEQIFTIDYDDIQGAKNAPIYACVERFLLSLLNLEEPFSASLLSSEVRLGEDVVSRKRAKEHVDIWRSQFKKIVPLAFEADEAQRQGVQNSMFCMFKVAYETTDLKGNTKEEASAGVAQMTYEEENWCIQGASFAGFEF